MFQALRNRAARRRVEQLIRSGVGIQEAAWPLDAGDAETGGLASAIEDWVRQALGRTRRPNGVNTVALAMACRDGAGKVVCSNATGLMPPAAFYSAAGAAAISGFLSDATAVPARSRHEVVCALISVGDLLYALDDRRAA